MKKLILILTAIAFLNSGCSNTNEKVNIIKGAGNANNSLVLSFNELCPGSVEGFGASNNDVIISQRNGEKLELFNCNAASKEKTFLMSSVTENRYAFEISPTGKRIILNNQLYDSESRNITYLSPVIPPGMKPQAALSISSYTFWQEDEVVLTDPYYYLNKYFKAAIKSFQIGQSDVPSLILAGDLYTGLRPESYSGIKAPDINGILNYWLLPHELKFIFMGFKSKSGEISLYSFDIVERSFKQLDTGVKSFKVSPDGRQICFVKSDGQSSENTLYTLNIDGTGKKELVKASGIKETVWSSDSRWIAYISGDSAGDVFVVKTDGTAQEQLTHNMNADGKLAWNGNRLAFTTSSVNKEENNKVYMITLNVENSETPISSVEPRDLKLSSQLIAFLRNETAINLKNKQQN